MLRRDQWSRSDRTRRAAVHEEGARLSEEGARSKAVGDASSAVEGSLQETRHALGVVASVVFGGASCCSSSPSRDDNQQPARRPAACQCCQAQTRPARRPPGPEVVHQASRRLAYHLASARVPQPRPPPHDIGQPHRANSHSGRILLRAWHGSASTRYCVHCMLCSWSRPAHCTCIPPKHSTSGSQDATLRSMCDYLDAALELMRRVAAPSSAPSSRLSGQFFKHVTYLPPSSFLQTLQQVSSCLSRYPLHSSLSFKPHPFFCHPLAFTT